VAASVALAVSAPVRAGDEQVRVPIALQAELLSKVARYDQNLSARASERLRILILHRADDPQSVAHGKQLKAALQASPVLTDRPQDIELEPMGTAAAVAEACKTRKLSILVLSSGFSPTEVRALAAALKGVQVLSAGLGAKDADAGMVLAFDLVASKPKIVVNVRQAQAQDVSMASALLGLARVIP
jgi:hypothetical protein